MPLKPAKPRRRRICFVTGTRAEFGLMGSTLSAIKAHPNLHLQIIVTGMHLDDSLGSSRKQIQAHWNIDRTVPWKPSSDPLGTAEATGFAIGGLSQAFRELKPDIILVVGDRVEAFAAAAAGHIGGLIVAQVHGGDRAQGQVDDSLRHAITKLSHVHFPATKSSARRIAKLGEDRRRIHHVGSPGNDGIARAAMKRLDVATYSGGCKPGTFALVVLHPIGADGRAERRRAKVVLDGVRRSGFQAVVVYPNNDPGSAGIVSAWKSHAKDFAAVHANVARPAFLGLLRDAAVLVGNSSSGIIEAGSFGTPVVDIGPRQKGRERGSNVINVPYSVAAIAKAVGIANKNRNAARFRRNWVYAGDGAGQRIANTLADLRIDIALSHKLITY